MKRGKGCNTRQKNNRCMDRQTGLESPVLYYKKVKLFQTRKYFHVARYTQNFFRVARHFCSPLYLHDSLTMIDRKLESPVLMDEKIILKKQESYTRHCEYIYIYLRQNSDWDGSAVSLTIIDFSLTIIGFPMTIIDF